MWEVTNVHNKGITVMVNSNLFNCFTKQGVICVGLNETLVTCMYHVAHFEYHSCSKIYISPK